MSIQTIRIMPAITRTAPIRRINVICSPRNRAEHSIVISGELDITIVTSDTSPFFNAA